MSQDKPSYSQLRERLEKWRDTPFNEPVEKIEKLLTEAVAALRALEAERDGARLAYQSAALGCDSLQRDNESLRGWLGEALDGWARRLDAPIERIAEIRKAAGV
jgi:hypothetical protein